MCDKISRMRQKQVATNGAAVSQVDHLGFGSATILTVNIFSISWLNARLRDTKCNY